MIEAKQSLFREWHDDWLMEWVHYVPLSLNVGVEGRGWESPQAMHRTGRQSEWAEVLRWFLDADGRAEDIGGRGPGTIMAMRKRMWSEKVLRREDMQARCWTRENQGTDGATDGDSGGQPLSG